MSDPFYHSELLPERQALPPAETAVPVPVMPGKVLAFIEDRRKKERRKRNEVKK
jgi:hypothetical protein